MVGKSDVGHLEADPRDAAQCLGHREHLRGYGRRVTDEVGAIRSAHGIECRAGDGREATLASDTREHFGMPGIERVSCLLVGVGHEADAVLRILLGENRFEAARDEGTMLPICAAIELVQPAESRTEVDTREGLTAREVEVLTQSPRA